MKRYILTLIISLTALGVQAQSNRLAKETNESLIRAALKGWHVRLGAGVSLGGMSPLPLPAEIRSINGYKPTLCISLEGAAQKKFDEHWGMLLGIRLERKGMETNARVKNYHMEAISLDGSNRVVGAWTGHVKTEVANNYMTFPVLATYSFNDRWQVQAGPYLSWMMNGSFTGEAYDGYIRNENPTGEKTEFGPNDPGAVYDFSNDLRRFHWGVQVGGEFKAFKHLSVSANLQWGLNGIFPSDFGSVTFALYPIYFNLGFNYLF